MTSQWNAETHSFYVTLENGQGMPSNSLAYETLAHMAFANIYAKFVDKVESIYVGDVGCYLGGTTHRWLQTGSVLKPSAVELKVLGTDIHAENVQGAREKYGNEPDVQFEVMVKNEALPRIDGQPFHLIFATFVMDTIPLATEVEALTSNIVDALVEGGEFYFIRLHPNSLKEGQFREYNPERKAHWNDGDEFLNRLISIDGTVTPFPDYYWSPEFLERTFQQLGCQVELFDVTAQLAGRAGELLREQIALLGFQQSDPEWTVPLYMIGKVTRY